MTAVRYVVAVKRPHVTCMVNGEHIISGQEAGERSVCDNKANEGLLL